MSALTILIPVALFLGAIGLIGFFWALRSGQFDDLDGAAMRILIDDEDDVKLSADNDDTDKSRQPPSPPPASP